MCVCMFEHVCRHCEKDDDGVRLSLDGRIRECSDA